MSVTRRYTIADLEQMPAREGERYEIIDGALYVAKQPSGDHQYAVDELQAALRLWSHQTQLGMSFSAPGLVFDGQNSAAPDVAWMSVQRIAESRDRAGHFVHGPELVVEVHSPGTDNVRRDRDIKLELYSREGVDEYWIVDGLRRVVDVYRREGPALAFVRTLSGDDDLETPLLPGFRFPLARLWAPGWLPDLREPSDRP